MLNPENIADYRRLKTSSDWSLTQKRKFEEHRMRMLKRMVGPYFGEDGCEQKRPVNMIELGVDIFSRGVASHRPQAIVSSEFRELQSTAYDFEIVLNRRIESLRLQRAINIVAIESLFTLGVMCVGLNIEGDNDPGRVFAEPVLFPDLVPDMSAKSWEAQTYIGHDFLVPYDQVKDSPLYEGKGREYVIRQRDMRMKTGRDWGLSRDEQYLNMVRLRQYYLPHLNRVIICDPELNLSLRTPMMSHEWEGPEHGPYTPFYFKVVPGHLMPLALVPMWYDLDDVINKAFGKSARQALRSKTIGLASDPDDAQAINKTEDGHTVSVSRPDAILEKTYGGTNQTLVGIMQLSKQLLVYLGGNWDALGGLAAMSGTASQDQLLAQGASGRMKDMQQRMIEFQTKIVSDIAHWVWTDPLTEERFSKPLPGTPYAEPTGVWSPETRQGEFFHYNFSVNPYTFVQRSPNEQAAMLTQILQNVLLPALPFMQNGSPVDWEEFFDLLAHYMNLPELRRIIRWPQGESTPEPMPETPRKPANTTRTYERVNRQSSTQAGSDAVLASLFTAAHGGTKGIMQPLG